MEINKDNANAKECFSYSKLNTYETCSWQYFLKYVNKDFVDSPSIAADFGTLVHYIEETIAKDIMENDGEPNFMIDDNKYIDLFINADIHTAEETILGVKKLKDKYPDDFYIADKSGYNYNDKANDYLNFGIYRLRDYLAENRHLKLIAVEQPFNVEYEDYKFHGVIDRILLNTITNTYIIEDIKTWPTITDHDIVTPLQFVFYTLAMKELYNVDEVSCFYDLPLVHERFSAGTKNYIKRGKLKINKLLQGIKDKSFEPSPSPLCFWCPYSNTFPKKLDTIKEYCPYHSFWTKTDKNFKCEYLWMGIENHKAIIDNYNEAHSHDTDNLVDIKADIIMTELKDPSRRFLLRS